MAKRLSIVIAGIPVVALTFAIPFVDYDQPRILGLPFVLVWIVAWCALSPAFLWIVHRNVEGRR